MNYQFPICISRIPLVGLLDLLLRMLTLLASYLLGSSEQKYLPSTLFFTTAAHWVVVVIESKNLLLDLLTFSYSPTRATRDIVVEGNELEELEEVKTLWKASLELC